MPRQIERMDGELAALRKELADTRRVMGEFVIRVQTTLLSMDVSGDCWCSGTHTETCPLGLIEYIDVTLLDHPAYDAIKGDEK